MTCVLRSQNYHSIPRLFDLSVALDVIPNPPWITFPRFAVGARPLVVNLVAPDSGQQDPPRVDPATYHVVFTAVRTLFPGLNSFYPNQESKISLTNLTI